MIPAWKLKREVRRLRDKARFVLLGVRARAMGIVWTWLRPRLIEVQEGTYPPGRRVALFLVFQPLGCPESLFDTLEAIRGEGYAPLVVVNGHLDRTELDRLAHHAWRVMKRPNVGYDFGGYRDGIWYLRSQDVPIDALLVLNDTVWLPAGGKSFTLKGLEEIDADFAALSNFVYRPRRKRANHLTGRTYASSFGFLISHRVWASWAFHDFWKRLPLYGSKPKVVEHGEVGFSDAMDKAGFAPVALLDHARVRETVFELPSDRQEEFLHRLPVLSHALRESHEDLLDRIDRGTARPSEEAEFLARTLDGLNPWDSMVVHGLVNERIDFIKKANLKKPNNARRFLADLDRTGFILNGTVRSEIEAIAGRGQ